MIYAIYKNKIYLANMRESRIRLKTRISEEGFNKLVDLAGNVHKDIFIKEVDIDDIDSIYELEYRIIYRGNEYKCLKVAKGNLDIDYITIYTSNVNLGKQYGFIKKEQFIFEKDVYLNEIDELIEIKIPILKFNNLKSERIKISGSDIRDYLLNIIE